MGKAHGINDGRENHVGNKGKTNVFIVLLIPIFYPFTIAPFKLPLLLVRDLRLSALTPLLPICSEAGQIPRRLLHIETCLKHTLG